MLSKHAMRINPNLTSKKSAKDKTSLEK